MLHYGDQLITFVCLPFGAAQIKYSGFYQSFSEQLPAAAGNKADESAGIEANSEYAVKPNQLLLTIICGFMNGSGPFHITYCYLIFVWYRSQFILHLLFLGSITYLFQRRSEIKVS